MLIEWNDALLVGHRQIDCDHHAMVVTINRLYDDIKSGKDFTIISEIMNYLAEQTYIHTSYEYWLMETSSYPRKELHDDCHKKLREELDGLIQSMTLSSSELTIRASTFFKHWFVDHVQNEDVALTEFLRRRGSLGD